VAFLDLNDTKDNLLSDFVTCDQLKVVPLNSGHSDWAKSEKDRALVIDQINSDF
jgi:hypothetical protein